MFTQLIPAVATPMTQAERDQLDARRYRFLRDGNGYLPEEEMVRGGDELDALCDYGIAEQAKQVKP